MKVVTHPPPPGHSDGQTGGVRPHLRLTAHIHVLHTLGHGTGESVTT